MMSSQEGRAPRQPEVRITSASGSITVVAESRIDVVADGAARVDIAADGSIEVFPPRGSTSITVRCPEGADIVVGTRSGSLHLRGHLGAVLATTLSGRIEADDVASADLRAVSGSIVVGTCTETCRVKTKSGSIRIGSAGAAEIMMGSGKVEVASVEGALKVRAVSGSVGVVAEGHGPIEVETMSGSITITLPSACRPDVRARSLSSRPRIELPAGTDCEVVARTLSGAIVVRAT
jgi:DUF4097 and DUF4098 domain-containing protein YvlB